MTQWTTSPRPARCCAWQPASACPRWSATRCPACPLGAFLAARKLAVVMLVLLRRLLAEHLRLAIMSAALTLAMCMRALLSLAQCAFLFFFSFFFFFLFTSPLFNYLCFFPYFISSLLMSVYHLYKCTCHITTHHLIGVFLMRKCLLPLPPLSSGLFIYVSLPCTQLAFFSLSNGTFFLTTYVSLRVHIIRTNALTIYVSLRTHRSVTARARWRNPTGVGDSLRGSISTFPAVCVHSYTFYIYVYMCVCVLVLVVVSNYICLMVCLCDNIHIAVSLGHWLRLMACVCVRVRAILCLCFYSACLLIDFSVCVFAAMEERQRELLWLWPFLPDAAAGDGSAQPVVPPPV